MDSVNEIQNRKAVFSHYHLFYFNQHILVIFVSQFDAIRVAINRFTNYSTIIVASENDGADYPRTSTKPALLDWQA